MNLGNSVLMFCAAALVLALLSGCAGRRSSLNDLPVYDPSSWKELEQEERAQVFLPDVR